MIKKIIFFHALDFFQEIIKRAILVKAQQQDGILFL